MAGEAAIPFRDLLRRLVNPDGDEGRPSYRLSEIAAATGLSAAYLRLLLAGTRSNPTQDVMRSLLIFFEEDPRYFYDGILKRDRVLHGESVPPRGTSEAEPARDAPDDQVREAAVLAVMRSSRIARIAFRAGRLSDLSQESFERMLADAEEAERQNGEGSSPQP